MKLGKYTLILVSRGLYLVDLILLVAWAGWNAPMRHEGRNSLSGQPGAKRYEIRWAAPRGIEQVLVFSAMGQGLLMGTSADIMLN